jgi:hypothetical protein
MRVASVVELSASEYPPVLALPGFDTCCPSDAQPRPAEVLDRRAVVPSLVHALQAQRTMKRVQDEA